MKLGRKQEIFAQRFALLVLYANALPGYSARIDMVRRTDEEAARLGFEDSLHTLKLAGDLLLFYLGEYLRESGAYEALGLFWQSFSGEYDGEPLEFCWGGRFGDGNHFSIAHGDRK